MAEQRLLVRIRAVKNHGFSKKNFGFLVFWFFMVFMVFWFYLVLILQAMVGR